VAQVFIPTLLQNLTGGRASVEVDGATVRQVIDNLERNWPGIRDRLVDADRMRPNISVAVDGEVSPLGLAETVESGSEVHFIAAIRGG
jgi:molybdopterin converting factor small subunit